MYYCNKTYCTMKYQFFLWVIIPLNLFAQKADTTTISVFAELGVRTYEDAPRVLLKQGNDSPVADLFVKVGYENAYAWVLTGADLGIYNTPNPAANYLQFTGGYVINAGKFSFDINLSTFLGGTGNRYLRLDLGQRLFIPNVFVRYKVNDNQSAGLWLNYFESGSHETSAPMVRADYSIIGGKIQFVAAYSGGPFGFDPGINAGVRYSEKLTDLGKKFSLHSQFNLYENIWSRGDNPFTSTTFGGGLVIRFLK